MTERSSTFRCSDYRRRDISGGTDRWPIGVITDGGGRAPIDGQRTVLTVRRPGPCGLTCTV